MSVKKLLGEILCEMSNCTNEDILNALSVQKEYGGKIGTILLNMGVITEGELLKALSKQLNLEYLENVENIDFVDCGIDFDFLRTYRIFPYKIDNKTVSVIVNDPLKVEIFSFIERKISKSLIPVITNEENLKNLFVQLETDEIITESAINLEDEIDKLKELASEAPVIKLVNSILAKAVDLNASDIHFEALRNQMKVRYRVDGVLISGENISFAMKYAIITRLKLMSKMNIAESRLPQDGRLAVRVQGKDIDIRASSVPTQFGESFVLRLLGKENIDYSLESLGFYNDHVEAIRKVSKKPYGIFLTTGPTGSGKTTTLYSILNELNDDKRKIITVEDPVEYEFKGINQISVKTDIGYTFANALRSILRQDPDIIMVGEIRDRETAEIAIQASLTGHLVLATLHTNSALASISRMIDMGVDFFLLKASIIGLMAQRLVRTFCDNCAEQYELTDQDYTLFNIQELKDSFGDFEVAPRKAVGCKHCNYTGYRGRMVISEVVPFDEHLIHFFEQDQSFKDMKKAGYRTMYQDGLIKVLTGKTSFDEVLRVSE